MTNLDAEQLRPATFEPRPSPEALCEHGPDDIRWWTLDQRAEATDAFASRHLPTLARDIVRAGPPDRPIDVGVLAGHHRRRPGVKALL